MSTYVPIQAITLSAAASSVTFSGIPQTFTDLVLVCNTIVASGTGSELSLQFNDDTGTNYSNTYLLGTGSAAVSGRGTNFAYADCGYLSANAGNPNTRIINIQNYSNITTNKTLVSRASSDNGQQVTAYANLWRSTAAINKIKVYSASSLSYASGSTFTLYGIGSGAPKAFGGDVVVNDGTYWYHAFRSSGTFTPVQSLSADVLVIAGGGSGTGGDYSGGGGGAGGLRYFSAQSLTTTSSYTVTVGAGATAKAINQGTGVDGSNSQFGTLTVSTGGGGGGGGTAGPNHGRAGGSGGGAASTDGTGGSTVNGGAASPSGQGNAGGSNGGNIANPFPAGGGGGAGVAGSNASASLGGIGGDGSTAYSSWGSATSTGENVSGTRYYAGGGAGGTYYAGSTVRGGYGGGGNASTGAGGNGVSNTGGGGGGGNNTQKGGNGGSGIVIVRYAV